MSLTADRPPIFRFAAWVAKRKTMCEYCHKRPKATPADTPRYCSDSCAEADWEDQAHG